MRRLVGSLALVLLAAPLAAEVQIGVRDDGTRVLYNESVEQRVRRLATRLLPVPSHALEELIFDHAYGEDLDPRLVQAVIQVESGYNPKALSNKGAMGLMQLMPDTATELAVSDPYDPEQNVRGGTTYLRRMMDRFAGDLELALAAYNAGPDAVAKYQGVPPFPDTQDYVTMVLKLLDGGAGGDERVGRRVFMVRDANNQLRLTTSNLSPRR
jgi:hypothetical protein